MAAMSPSGCLSVVLNASAIPEDMLKAYFVCVVFWEKVRPKKVHGAWGLFGQARGWSYTASCRPLRLFRQDWSTYAVLYVLKVTLKLEKTE